MAYRTTSWKNTDIGKIPSDWNLVKLGEHCKMFSGGTPSVGETEYYCGDIPFIRSGEIHDSKTELTITEVGLRSSSAKLVKKGDILYALYGATSGDVSLSNIEGAINQAILCIRPDKILLSKYLVDFLCKEKGNIVNTYLQGGQGNLSGQIVKNIILSIPQMPEQQKIAAVLTDLDDLIAELENVRDKKQAIKIGAMQELLTGKRRLPGFNKPWKKVELGEIADLLKGRGLSKDKVDPKGRYSCVLYGELFTIYKEKIAHVISKTDYEEGVFSKEGDVLVPGSTTTTGIDLAKASALLQGGVLLGGDINIIRIKERDINPIFLAYLITNTQKNEIGNIAKGTTVYHLHGTDLAVLIIYIPMDKSEQTAIANILSDMDDEISAINDKINKYKQIKAGVADELLSGRIRLIKPQE